MLAELLAIRWCLQMAKSMAIEHFMLHSHARFVVDCINNLQVSGHFHDIVVDCRILLESFVDASVIYLSRKKNGDAHFMAGVGKSEGSRTWLGCIPQSNPTPSHCFMFGILAS